MLAEDVQLEALYALWWGERHNLVSTSPKVCLDLTDLTGTEIRNL